MFWQGIELLLDLAALSLCPTRTRTPPATARNGAGTRIIVDRKLERCSFRQRTGGPFQPSQPLDGQVR